MFRLRLRWAAPGMAGWVLRLVFAASAVVGAYGAYTAMVASVWPRDPGHDHLHGLALMGVALGASLLALLLLFRLVDGPAGDTRPTWYLAIYGLFVLTALAVLCVASTTRYIVDWHRSDVTVTATATSCASSTDSNGNVSYSCDLDWTWAGVQHQQNRRTHGVYPDGTAVALWIDPANGGADDHSYVPIVLLLICSLVTSAAALVGWVMAIVNGLADWRKRLRAWLDSVTWWVAGPRPR